MNGISVFESWGGTSETSAPRTRSAGFGPTAAGSRSRLRPPAHAAKKMKKPATLSLIFSPLPGDLCHSASLGAYQNLHADLYRSRSGSDTVKARAHGF